MSRTSSLVWVAVSVAIAVSALAGCSPRDRSTTEANTTTPVPLEIPSNTTSPVYAMARTTGITLDTWQQPKSSALVQEEKLERLLAQKVEFKINVAPISEVFETLGYEYGVDFVLDCRAMADEGLIPDPPISISVSDVSLASAVDRILAQVDLSWTVRDATVLITSIDEAESMLTTKVYDVTDLVVCRDSAGELWDDFDNLIVLITDTLDETTWDGWGGAGTVAKASAGAAKVLVVSQSYRVHRKIANLLELLRNIAASKSRDGKPPLRNGWKSNQPM